MKTPCIAPLSCDISSPRAGSACLLCHQPDSQIHMLSGLIQTMVIGRHNVASRLILSSIP